MTKYDEIKNFWDQAGKSELDNQGLKSTARDPYLQFLIEKNIIKFLKKDNKLLDIGCGEGSSTKIFSPFAIKIVGIDYSKSLIEQANKNNSNDNIEYFVDNVLTLESIEDESFDISINIRCLINLPDEDMQYKGLSNIFKKIKKGGLCIFNEGTCDEFENLNVYRQKNNLSSFRLAEYNKLFENKKIKNFLSDYGDILEIITIGDYIYGSRVLHPLIVGEKNVKHDSKINEVFANNFLIDNYDRRPEFSYSSIYVVRKN
jgi:SAM-dependent methyltransferase